MENLAKYKEALIVLPFLLLILLLASVQPVMISEISKDLLNRKSPASSEVPVKISNTNDSMTTISESSQQDVKISDEGPRLNMSSIAKEKIYDTGNRKFRIHYTDVSEDYVKFVGYAFSKASEFQLSLGFNNIILTPNAHDFKDGKVAIYVKDSIDDNACKAVTSHAHLQYMGMSDDLEKWQIYLAAAHCYFKAVEASYNTLEYEASEGNAWINDGIARFIVLYTAMNDPEYKQYDEEYNKYGYLNNVMVEGKKTYGYAPYQVPTITEDAPLQYGITKLGSLSVSYWYYLHKLYGMQIIEDVVAKSGFYKGDSVELVSSVLANYNTTFAQSVTGWYESIGFWNKGKIGDFSVYEGLTLVDDEIFKDYRSSELPINIENRLMEYGASFVSLDFDSGSPIVQLRFLNLGEIVYLYVYIHNTNTDKYYYQTFNVERGHQDFLVWTENAEINFIIIGGEKSFTEGFRIAAL